MKNQPRQLYGNCRVFNIDNEHIFNCNGRKKKWYLDRGLATIIQEDPPTIRLNFKTKGPGNKNDPYYLQERKSLCVVCGSTEQLQLHHIVPLMYRRYMPPEIKNFSSFDILPVCSKCHKLYEIQADQLKIQIRDELGIEMRDGMWSIYWDVVEVVKAAKTILKHGDRVPDPKKEKFLSIMKKHLGKEELDSNDIEELTKLKTHIYNEDHKTEGQLVVERMPDLELFIRRWRKHFIDVLSPKFLPEHWNANRPVDRAEKKLK